MMLEEDNFMKEDWNVYDIYKESIENGSVIEIDKQYRIYIMIDSGDREKIKKCFTEVWEGIPKEHKDILFRYWDSKPYRHVRINVLLKSMTSGQAWQGKEIEFNAKDFDELPESACRFLIAHELGHCMLYAQGIKLDSVDHDIGRARYCDSTGHFWGYKQDHENEADRWARAWGQTMDILANGFILPDLSIPDDLLVEYDYTLKLSCSGVIGLLEKQDIKEGARIQTLLQQADDKRIIKLTVRRENSSEEQEISLNNPVWDNT